MARLIRFEAGAALLAALAVLCAPAEAQFTRNTAAVPGGGVFNGSSTENVDFGDVDNDGDWDAIFADGGDCCDDQDRIWINQGGLQGGTVGVFLDETSTRFPAILQGGRDVEFVDLDRDGDLDIYTSNTSEHSNQSNRWWINQGGLQGGSAGFLPGRPEPLGGHRRSRDRRSPTRWPSPPAASWTGPATVTSGTWTTTATWTWCTRATAERSTATRPRASS